MSNIIFSSEFFSNVGEKYKVDLHSETYIGLNAIVTGGLSNTFFLDKDWTAFLNNGQPFTVDGSDGFVNSFSYDSVNNITNVITTIIYGGQVGEYFFNDDSRSGSYIPTFAPIIRDISTEWVEDGDMILASMKSSSTSVTYMNKENSFDRFMDMFLGCNDNELKLVIYKENSSDWELEWVGNIVSDLWEWDNTPKPRPLTIKAIDGIDRLKDIIYEEPSATPSNKKIIDHIKNILDRNDLSQFWGASDPYIRESVEYDPLDITFSLPLDSPLDATYINDRMFFNPAPDSQKTSLTCYEALKGLVEIFSCRIFISKGCYYIQQPRNFNWTSGIIHYRQYSKTGSAYAHGTYNDTLDAGGNDRAEPLVVMGGGKFGYLAGLNEVTMDVNRLHQKQINLPIIEAHTSNNTYSETFPVFGGVGKGATLRFECNVIEGRIMTVGDYCIVSIALIESGGGGYIYAGGGGWKAGWYPQGVAAKQVYDFKVSVGNAFIYFETEEIPFEGNLDFTMTITQYDRNNNILNKGPDGRFYVWDAKFTYPHSNGEDIDIISAENPAVGKYTKSLTLDPLIITDYSNLLSLNTITLGTDSSSVYNKGVAPTNFIEASQWDAGFSTNPYLSIIRVLEAMSLQAIPVERYMGSFEGQYYPHLAIGYNDKTYMFNAFRKNYQMDENEGEWIEQINTPAGIIYKEIRDKSREPDGLMRPYKNGAIGDAPLGSMMDNNHIIGRLSADQSSVSGGALDINSVDFVGALKGDNIIAIDPLSNRIIDEFTLDADIEPESLQIPVEVKTLANTLPEGTAFQLKKQDIFRKLNGGGIIVGAESTDITSDQDNYDIGSETVVFINPTGASVRQFSGLNPSAYTNGRSVTIVNVNATSSAQFNSEDTGSDAENRIGSLGFSISPKQANSLVYSTHLDRWLLNATPLESEIDYTIRVNGVVDSSGTINSEDDNTFNINP